MIPRSADEKGHVQDVIREDGAVAGLVVVAALVVFAVTVQLIFRHVLGIFA